MLSLYHYDLHLFNTINYFILFRAFRNDMFKQRFYCFIYCFTVMVGTNIVQGNGKVSGRTGLEPEKFRTKQTRRRELTLSLTADTS